MAFNSLQYLVFFVVVFLIYYILPLKYRWICLLAASGFFYYMASPIFALFLIFSITVTYSCAIIIDKIDFSKQSFLDKSKDKLDRNQLKEVKNKYNRRKKAVLVLTLILNIGVLVFFKYNGYLFESLRNIFGTSSLSTPALFLILPLGISFYTFSSIGYCIDVYRGEHKPQKNIAKYALFVSYFPHIIQGPIGSYKVLSSKLYEPKTFSHDNVTSGLMLIAWGIFKKMVVADRMAVFVNEIYGSYELYPGSYLIIATLMYAVQIYADFSGYIDMARGSSKCLGIDLQKNFLRPYFSKSIAEFWRRWHISLGVWFRNYMFYPILRSDLISKLNRLLKKKASKYVARKLPSILALFIIWVLIGAWHGAEARFIAYGLYHGGLIILAMLFEPVFEKIIDKFKINTKSFLYKVFRVSRTFLLVSLGYVFFRSQNMGMALSIYKKMIVSPFKLNLTKLGLELSAFGYGYIIPSVIFVSIIFITSLIQRKTNIMEALRNQSLILRWSIYIAIMLIIIIFSQWGYTGANQFIYYKF